MKRLSFLHRLVGLIVVAALLFAPLSAHADAGDVEQTGVFAALSSTCLDLGGDEESGIDHDAAACHACPLGCFASGTLVGVRAPLDALAWKRLVLRGTQETRHVQALPDLCRARSPPVA